MTSERRLELQRKLAEHVGWTDLALEHADDLNGSQLFGFPPHGYDKFETIVGPNLCRTWIPPYVLNPWDMVQEYHMDVHSSYDENGMRNGHYAMGMVEDGTSIKQSYPHSDPRDAVFELYCRLKGLI